ncbi:MAG: hypothetical protein C4545_10790 [Anaerolineaceae bacterium]|jgi:hypothetical protein|nr:MAG: hypothetical protein C4545_10790 [Anaerolineaceae bacterium]
MPKGDRTGPAGAGMMTGRRAGYCAGFSVPGYMNTGVPWRGFGFGGVGRGWRNTFYATGVPGWQRFGYPPMPPQEETESLKTQADWLKDQLDAINKRIEELESK